MKIAIGLAIALTGAGIAYFATTPRKKPMTRAEKEEIVRKALEDPAGRGELTRVFCGLIDSRQNS